MAITNNSNIPLSLAVWLAYDQYDHNPDPYTISATSLMKPVRKLILGNRAAQGAEPLVPDVLGRVGSAVGTAIHTAIEEVWSNKKMREKALTDLGFPEKMIKRILINPKPSELVKGCIPIYMELRSHRKVGKYTVSGKFDFVAEDTLRDFKKTKVFKYMKESADNDYRLQGSIYRWLNPKIIKKDHMFIDFIFTDWIASQAKANKNYPPTEATGHRIALKSIESTNAWVEEKIALIEAMQDVDEKDLPPCTPEDLWQTKPVFKYYADPNKTTKSTKNFDDSYSANAHAASKGKGIVLEVPGEAKACKYCDGFDECTQKDELIESGVLKIM